MLGGRGTGGVRVGQGVSEVPLPFLKFSFALTVDEVHHHRHHVEVGEKREEQQQRRQRVGQELDFELESRGRICCQLRQEKDSLDSLNGTKNSFLKIVLKF